MSAAPELVATDAAEPVPVGVPVRSGRLSLGRVRRYLPASGPVLVLAGFGTACWLGSPDDAGPDLGRLVCRAEARLDGQDRLVLTRRVRSWLCVSDPALFRVELLPLHSGGVLVVPVEDMARRRTAVTP